MVASVSSWHERHEDAATAIEARLSRGDQMIIAAHSIVETYAVLTRLPPGRRLSPRNARAIIEGSFLSHGTIISLPVSAYVDLLQWLADHDVAGGRTYDALIVAAAEHGRVETVLTLNGRDFEALARSSIEIVVL
jgi:predicted nucleic acid-binding protein